MNVLFDKDIESIPMSISIRAIEDFFESAKLNKVVTPTRSSINTDKGGLTFTMGAEVNTSKTIGFRVYDTYPNESPEKQGSNTDQIVVVYSTEKSELKTVVIGSLLGAIRTAAIGGYAAKLMSNKDANNVCIIGAGLQAYYQIKAMLAVRDIKEIHICNRTISKAQNLKDKLELEFDLTNLKITANEPSVIEKKLKTADIIICATNSNKPVLQKKWIKQGAYVASIGPKFHNNHELPLDILSSSNITISDAPEQLKAYPKKYFLDDLNNIHAIENYSKLDKTKNGYQLFLSTGRSGTEVIVADYLNSYLKVI
ncbi:MAG: hypothetical protein HRU38_15680 [Saccharospirillaceae bacterium]|nr:hypothetical protein [Pseudomonadales bacterium]NRB80081.1 hypothetical protein [Saccharospirillaceae bacterium]